MKVIAPFILLTGVIWSYGLQSPEECNPSVSYADQTPAKLVSNQLRTTNFNDSNKTTALISGEAENDSTQVLLER